MNLTRWTARANAAWVKAWVNGKPRGRRYPHQNLGQRTRELERVRLWLDKRQRLPVEYRPDDPGAASPDAYRRDHPRFPE